MDMPLTPADVRNKQFSTTRLRPGYDEEEVDAFLDEVEAELDRLIQENEELRGKLSEVLRGGKAPVALNAPHADPPPELIAPPEPPRIEPERGPQAWNAMPRNGTARRWGLLSSRARNSSGASTTCVPSSGSTAAGSRRIWKGSFVISRLAPPTVASSRPWPPARSRRFPLAWDVWN